MGGVSNERYWHKKPGKINIRGKNILLKIIINYLYNKSVRHVKLLLCLLLSSCNRTMNELRM